MNETNMDNTAPRQGTSMAIPIAIVIGFGLIALSIYLSGGKQAATNTNLGLAPEEEASLSTLAPVTAEDHIRGNPNAPLMIVEYVDFDCPHCRNFHTTMQKIMDEYGPGGQVAWVVRQLPLTSLHPSAGHIAEASECVAELGGNEAFWKFSDMVFGERADDGFTDLVRLPEFAEASGVSKTEYQACIDSGRNQAKIDEDMEDLFAAVGPVGTPYSIAVMGDQRYPIEGAQPYDGVKLLVDGLLNY